MADGRESPQDLLTEWTSSTNKKRSNENDLDSNSNR